MRYTITVDSSGEVKTFHMPTRATQLARLTAILIAHPSAIIISDKQPDKFERAATGETDAVIEVLA